MKNIDISIIIISYNVQDKIIDCCKKIINIKNSEIIVIDNNSTDDSYKELNESFKNEIILKKNSSNLGFSKAVNQGISLSKGKYILLLNPDTTPTASNIKKLLNFLVSHQEAGLVGGMLKHYKTQKINGTCVNKPTFLTGIFEFTNLKKIFPNNKYSKIFYYQDISLNKPTVVYGLSGGFLLFKKKLIKEVGKLDENFFMYLEDVDFGIRVRSLGYKNYYVPGVSILHDSGSSSKNSKYRINVKAWRNSRNYFFRKHQNFLASLILMIMFFIDDFIVDLKHIILKEPLV